MYRNTLMYQAALETREDALAVEPNPEGADPRESPLRPNLVCVTIDLGVAT